MILITGGDILNKLGVPPASPVDAQWADDCAAAANAYVNRLPVGQPEVPEDDAVLGTVLLGANMYERRRTGNPVDGDPVAVNAVDSTVARLLRIGYYQDLWVV